MATAVLGVSADQSSHSGGVAGAPTCSLSVRMHAVWSPDGPQDGTACMSYQAGPSPGVGQLGSSPCHSPHRNVVDCPQTTPADETLQAVTSSEGRMRV